MRVKQIVNLQILITTKQGVQRLKALAFCVVTVNNEHMKPRFKIKFRG